MTKFFFSLIVLLSVALYGTRSFAWGRRGHATVCQTAAVLSSHQPKGDVLRAHSFDLGYYCNVPDLIWKKAATYDSEWFNHFMDLEIFNRGLKGSKIEKPFEMTRPEFDKAFPSIPNNAGRSWWRIRELFADMDGLVTTLKKADIDQETRNRAQSDWLIYAGAIGHYVGDLSQPLHVTENYDGQFSGQKGIHSFFEDAVVNELYSEKSAHLDSDVLLEAEQMWRSKSAKLGKQTPLEMLRALSDESNHELATLLKIDKRVGRDDVKKATLSYRSMVIKRLAAGAVVLAELYRRQLGWQYESKKFFNFSGEPAYIYAPGAPVAAPEKTAEKIPERIPEKTPSPAASPASSPAAK
jgi:hypothetical protein